MISFLMQQSGPVAYSRKVRNAHHNGDQADPETPMSSALPPICVAKVGCAICHVVAPDQPYQPVMRPLAPSFVSIIRKKTFDAESLSHFLKTTHRGLDNQQGMPNPERITRSNKSSLTF